MNPHDTPAAPCTVNREAAGPAPDRLGDANGSSKRELGFLCADCAGPIDLARPLFMWHDLMFCCRACKVRATAELPSDGPESSCASRCASQASQQFPSAQSLALTRVPSRRTALPADAEEAISVAALSQRMLLLLGWKGSEAVGRLLRLMHALLLAQVMRAGRRLRLWGNAQPA